MTDQGRFPWIGQVNGPGTTMLLKEHMGPLRLQFPGSSRAVRIASYLMHSSTCNVLFGPVLIIVTRRRFYPKQYSVINAGDETQGHSIPFHFRSTIRRKGIRDNSSSSSEFISDSFCEVKHIDIKMMFYLLYIKC
ncbi:hypothetical protein ALC62_10128 [Cyphomyrmex costatus]|uniref:Uncharacterized protein n=1 Tax=Cyphomyrmex costatus TaxID=456900 RepID=A0A195CE58_9HYME|nr:hypothetical protein ALC62_10128 [Cyphomyrmex costatus]